MHAGHWSLSRCKLQAFTARTRRVPSSGQELQGFMESDRKLLGVIQDTSPTEDSSIEGKG